MKVIGHRGAMGYEPENTLLAFYKAVEMGATAIELDVYLVRDKLIVFHDKRLNRTTNGKGSIYNMSVEELRRLNAGKGEKIPFLEEVIESMPDNILINIELKGKGTAIPVAELLNRYPHKHFVVSSFKRLELKKFQQVSDISLGILFNYRPLSFKRLVKSFPKAIAFNPSLKSVNSAMVADIHKFGYQVWVWTVNEVRDMERMKQLGVDAIFSDYPDRIQKLSREEKR